MYGIFDPFLPKINSKCPKSDEFRGWVDGDGWVRNFESIVPNFLVFVVAFLLPFLGVKSLGPDVSIIEFF